MEENQNMETVCFFEEEKTQALFRCRESNLSGKSVKRIILGFLKIIGRKSFFSEIKQKKKRFLDFIPGGR
jgi:hypothetical protein